MLGAAGYPQMFASDFSVMPSITDHSGVDSFRVLTVCGCLNSTDSNYCGLGFSCIGTEDPLNNDVHCRLLAMGVEAALCTLNPKPYTLSPDHAQIRIQSTSCVPATPWPLPMGVIPRPTARVFMREA